MQEHGFIVKLEIEGIHICDGTLLSENWVLTSAGCIGTHGRFLDELNISGTTADGQRWSTWVELVTVHPSFDSNTYRADLALVMLEVPAPEGVPFVVLQPDDFQLEFPATGRLVGFGATDSRCQSMPEALVEGDTRLVSELHCQVDDQFFDGALKLCGDHEEHSGEPGGLGLIAAAGCRDGGGPLLIDRESGAVQVGIISYKYESRDIYTHLRDYLPWIDETMSSPANYSILRQPTCRNSCCDNATWLDWNDRDCFAWRGLDCYKAIEHMNATFDQTRDLLFNCPATCGVCGACHVTNASCCDNSLYRDMLGRGCSDWQQSGCGAALPELNQKEYQDLLEFCPLTCGSCLPGSDCLDDTSFRDENGYTCFEWSGSDCSTATSNPKFAYTEEGQTQVMDRCRRSCGLCPTPVASTTNMAAASEVPMIVGGARPATVAASGAGLLTQVTIALVVVLHYRSI